MKAICILSLVLSLPMVLAAQTTAPLILKKDCDFQLDQLDISGGPKEATKSYSLDGQPYTGCARQDAPENEQYFLNFIKDGKLQRQLGYYYSGGLCRDYTFENGLADGVLRLYYPDGSPYIEEHYEQGQLHGSLKRWKNGVLLREAEFAHGEKLKEKLYDAQGTLLSEYPDR